MKLVANRQLTERTNSRISWYLPVTPSFNRKRVAGNAHFGYCHSLINIFYYLKIRFKPLLHPF